MSVELDRESLLVAVDGGLTLGELETILASQGFTMDVEGASGSRETVAAWLAAGARGARDAWLDPADHLVAGIDLRLHDERRVHVRAAPRRAVGPDLVTLAVGMSERFGTIERVALRIHPLAVLRPTVGRLEGDRDPPLEGGEQRLLEAIARALGDDRRQGGAPPTGR